MPKLLPNTSATATEQVVLRLICRRCKKHHTLFLSKQGAAFRKWSEGDLLVSPKCADCITQHEIVLSNRWWVPTKSKLQPLPGGVR